jgi:hypothetical protein
VIPVRYDFYSYILEVIESRSPDRRGLQCLHCAPCESLKATEREPSARGGITGALSTETLKCGYGSLSELHQTVTAMEITDTSYPQRDHLTLESRLFRSKEKSGYGPQRGPIPR